MTGNMRGNQDVGGVHVVFGKGAEKKPNIMANSGYIRRGGVVREEENRFVEITGPRPGRSDDWGRRVES